MKPSLAPLFALSLLASSGCSDDAKKAPPPARPAPTQPREKPFPALPCKKGEPRSVRDGKILACIVTAATKVGPITCAANAAVTLYADGKLKECTLARAHAYNGVPCMAGAPGMWFKSGKLYQCSVAKPYATSGVSCEGRLNYHENGKLHRCVLAESAEVSSVKIPAKSEVTFDDTGKPTKVKRPADNPVGKKPYECAEVEYDRSGAVTACTLAQVAALGTAKAPAGSRICFDAEGQPVTAAQPGCFTPGSAVAKPK